MFDSSYYASDKVYFVYAPELDSGWKCTPYNDGSKGTIGTIVVTTLEKREGPYEPLATKSFEFADRGCTDSPLYTELVDAFKAQFSKLEAY